MLKSALSTSTLSLSLLSCWLLAGCAQKLPDTASATPAVAADGVATVNGRTISRSTFNFYAQSVAQKPAAELTAEQRKELLESLIRGELIAQETEKSGLAAREETKAVLDLSRMSILQQAASEDFLKGKQATEAELRAEYDRLLTQMSAMEYRARHILVEDEKLALDLTAQLKRGASFQALARRHSKDTGSGANGGDLNWFAPERMVKPFADAVRALKAGQTTEQPVRTDFGWHIIRLEQTRTATPPTFESMQERLGQSVAGNKFKAHVDEQLKLAKIERSL